MGDGPGSVRPDGSVRKAVRTRPGYVPAELQPKYVAPPRRAPAAEPAPAPAAAALGTTYVTRPYHGRYPHQMTDDEVSTWLVLKSWLRPQAP